MKNGKSNRSNLILSLSLLFMALTSGCQNSSPTTASVPLSAANNSLMNTAGSPTTTATGDQTAYTGKFEGQRDHKTAGTITIQKSENGYALILEDDFSFNGAPDPWLAFGKNGYQKETNFSKLRANSGRQVYELPNSIKPEDYDEVWLWCRAFNVPLGTAKINKSK